MWLCILTGRQFEEKFENTQWRKSKKSAASVTMHLPVKIFSGYIWKRTVEKEPNKCNQCNFAAAQVSDLRRHFKRHSGEKSTKCNLCDFATSRAYVLKIHLKINAASVTMHCLWQAIWGDTVNSINLISIYSVWRSIAHTINQIGHQWMVWCFISNWPCRYF